MSSRAPLIGLSAGRNNFPTQARQVQMVWSGLNVNYVHSVIRSGATPVLIPCVTDPEAACAALKACDALVLTGGGDIDSLLYGQEPHPQCAQQDPVRDACEIALFHAARQRGIPIFGICRGIQLVNVAMGGDLIQDIPSQIRQPVRHSSGALTPVLLHSITMEPGSLVEQLMGVDSRAVNSWHHQSVGRVADGLRVTARAADGVIEALEAADGSPLLAVQWHPEEMAHTHPPFQRLFDWLVQI